MKANKNKTRIFFALSAIPLIVILCFLFSIRFKVDYYLWTAPDPIKGFSAHKGELMLIIDEIDSFMDSKDNFFKLFTGNCYVTNEGLIFDFQPQYSRNQTLHIVSNERWEYVKNHSQIFPEDFHYGHIIVDSKYPNYIFFRSDETVLRVLVYTRGERPTELIHSYWEDFEFVHVKQLAHGWYDIKPVDPK